LSRPGGWIAPGVRRAAGIGTIALAAVLAAGCATRQFDLQGHRGARGLAPENTLPAFTTALALGVTTLELDTAITRDGVIVVSHDPFLNPDITRGPDGVFLKQKGPTIHALTYDELMRYDVGRINPESRYAKTLPDQKPVDGTRFPRLAEVFALVRSTGRHDIRFNVETKVSPLAPDDTLPPEDFTNRLLAVIYADGMADQVTLQSFDWRTLRHAQRVAPGIPTVYLSAQQPWLDNIGAGKPEGSAWTAGFQARDHGGSVPRMVKAAGGAVWSPYFGDIDQAKVDEAHRLGLRVVVWTVNRPEDIARMFELGVDGIISDRPDRVRAAMAERKMPLPDAAVPK
jgi:glycerophosphoryl diester phosphodiesterase